MRIKFFQLRCRCIINHALADLTILQTALDPVPILVIIDPLRKPIGVIPQLVLLVAFAGDSLAGAFVGDNESEDSEADEQEDEDEHDEEVYPEVPREAAGANDAGDGDDEEEDAEGNYGFFEEALALGGASLGEPYAGHQDWD